MAGRYGGRFGTNQEQEQRRIQNEPVVVWKKEWVVPSGPGSNSNVKVLKWVRTGEVTKFDGEGEVGEETMAMEVDTSALLEPGQTTSAMDSLVTTPAPNGLTETLTPSATATAQPPSTGIDSPAEPPSVVANNDAAPVDSSQPLLTQPSVVSSQDPLGSIQELAPSSQAEAEAEEAALP